MYTPEKAGEVAPVLPGPTGGHPDIAVWLGSLNFSCIEPKSVIYLARFTDN